MKQLRIGDITIDAVIEREGPWRRPQDFFPAYDEAVFRHHLAGMEPEVFDAALGLMVITYQTFVVRTPRYTILVDTCTGEDKGHPPPFDFPGKERWRNELFALGISYEQVDYVFCTHLHIDHTGWNTVLRDGRWVPTFPNAKYIFHRTEYAVWEAEYAKGVAAHLRTDHTEFYVEQRHALDVIPRLPDWFDEPFADPSQIPTYLVSELTRKHVTVALSGDGGDELFAGYNRYLWAERLARAASIVPRGLHRPLANALRTLSPAAWNRLFGWIPLTWRTALPGDKLHKIAAVLENPDPDAIYRRLVSQWDKPDEVAAAGLEPRGLLWDTTIARDFPAFVPRMQYLDMVSYLPDDILTKVDRATMAVGLEGRVPLLDHRVVAYAWTLPFRFKVRGGSGKWLLRRVLDRYVPRPLIDRPKMGFGMPIDAWLRGPLREWAEQLLAPARLTSYGFVRVEPVRRAWREHLEGSRNWQYPLWTVLMLQAWRERWA